MKMTEESVQDLVTDKDLEIYDLKRKLLYAEKQWKEQTVLRCADHIKGILSQCGCTLKLSNTDIVIDYNITYPDV